MQVTKNHELIFKHIVQFSSQISDEGQNRQGVQHQGQQHQGVQHQGQQREGVPSCSQVAAMKEALFQILGDGDLIPDAVRLGKALHK